MNIKKLLLLPLIFLITEGCQKKTSSPTPANFEQSAIIKSALNESADYMIINIDLAKDFHAYGPKEAIGKPVRLVIEPDNGWAAIGEAVIPPGKHKKLSGLGDSYIIDGSFKVEQKLKPGTGTGKALLYLQICTDNSCDRPRTHELTLQPSAKK